MDSLTQIVLGAAVAEAALGKRVGNKALLWGGIAGTIPDLDVLFLALFGDGAIDEIVIHRGFSHSIVFAIMMAPVMGWIVHSLYNNRNEASFKQWSMLFFWAIFTHPLLDSLTTYGTQLFLPFSDYRVSIATVFVVDLFYTLPFLFSVIALSFVKRTSGLRKKLNYLGLSISTAYLLAGLINKGLSTDVFENDLANEPDKKELVFVGTTPLNIALWYGVAETDSAFHIGYYSLFDTTKDVSWVGFQKNHHLVSDIKNEYGVDRLMWFSDQLFVVTEAGADTLNFYTLKFGISKFESETPEGSFLFYMKVIREENGSLSYLSIREPDVDKMGEQIETLYRRIMGNKNVFRIK
jgi:inner membrane protein